METAVAMMVSTSIPASVRERNCGCYGFGVIDQCAQRPVDAKAE